VSFAAFAATAQRLTLLLGAGASIEAAGCCCAAHAGGCCGSHRGTGHSRGPRWPSRDLVLRADKTGAENIEVRTRAYARSPVSRDDLIRSTPSHCLPATAPGALDWEDARRS
jgi:hypothetical protein